MKSQFKKVYYSKFGMEIVFFLHAWDSYWQFVGRLKHWELSCFQYMIQKAKSQIPFCILQQYCQVMQLSLMRLGTKKQSSSRILMILPGYAIVPLWLTLTWVHLRLWFQWITGYGKEDKKLNTNILTDDLLIFIIHQLWGSRSYCYAPVWSVLHWC